MKNVTSFTRLFFGSTVAAVVLTLAACGDDDPVSVDPAEVEGTYAFEAYVFEPDAAVIPDYDMLDTLSSISLQLFSGGAFVLQYQFEGASSPTAATGNFSVTENEVRLAGNAADAARFQAILMESNATLVREANAPDVLTDTQRKIVNLSEFSDRYQGLPAVQGTLRLRLNRQ